MNRKTIDIIASFLIFIIAVLLGFYLGKHITNLGLIDIVWGILFFFLSLFLLIHIHELGHFFFGKLAGYKLIMYKAGPLCWKYENGHFKFELEKVKGYLGLCMMIPPATVTDKKSNLLYYAGGILMNILTGMIALLFALLTPNISSLLFLGLSIFGLLSIGMGVLNLRPSMSQNNPTDGMILWSLWKGNDFVEGFIMINRMQIELSMGIRPRDLKELTDEDGDTAEPYIRIYKLIYLLYKAWDERDMDKVKRQANRIHGMMTLVPTAVEDPVKFELCSAYAATGEIEKARNYYSEVQVKLDKENDCNGFRIKAYYTWFVEKDRDTALSLCRQGLAVTEKYPLKGQAVMEEELLKQLQSTIENNQ